MNDYFNAIITGAAVAIITCVLIVVFLCPDVFGQDTVSTVTTPANNGALIQNIVKYSPTAAYIGWTRYARNQSVVINVSQEVMPYIKRDTASKMPPFMVNSLYFPDSMLTVKEQIWLCSLTAHFRYKMRTKITLDSLCK
jgi:hypothetical protein